MRASRLSDSVFIVRRVRRTVHPSGLRVADGVQATVQTFVLDRTRKETTMHVYHFIGTNNVDCNIQPHSEICVSINKNGCLKLRSCYATWRTSPIEDVKIYDGFFSDVVYVHTANSSYSIACNSIKEARMLADAIRAELV